MSHRARMSGVRKKIVQVVRKIDSSVVKETLEQFLARGGEIEVCQPAVSAIGANGEFLMGSLTRGGPIPAAVLDANIDRRERRERGRPAKQKPSARDALTASVGVCWECVEFAIHEKCRAANRRARFKLVVG